MEAVIIVLALVAIALAVGWARERTLRANEDEDSRRELAEQRARRDLELKEQAQRTASLFDRMVEGLIVVDATGRIRLANRAAASLFRFEAPATGKTVLEATRHHDVAAVVSRLDRELEVLDHELRIESMEATRFIQVNALALRDIGGASDGAILVFHDLTRLRQLEGVRQEFVANVSHELRTPLSLIKSASETLLDGASADPAALKRFLGIIDKHANRLALLIDDLLLLSSLDSGGLRLDRQLLPFRITVQDAIDDLRPRARARNVELENLVPSSLHVLADNDRMRQVMFNLLDNAIKYGRADGTTKVDGRVLENGRVEISVEDDGPGIPKESQERIFERFYRVDKARSREQGGTGLGLAIVKHVVQAHGGEVWIESTVGSGSRFTFSLPTPAGPRSE
ncbi:MAG TPA: ATP-binding protein [Opitutaceae bacterium]|jgi:two-component system phosphate regulon sensor histidine kinase PhoR